MTDEMSLIDLDDLDGKSPQQMVVAGNTMQRIGTEYATAVSVQQPRDPIGKMRQLRQEALLAGEEFYYGWGAGRNRIEGPSVNLAMAAARIWGNCVVESMPVQDMDDSWVFTCRFVDLETGYTYSRQFRQSKHWEVHGKMDAERKDDIRFQIGQSKCARNLILNVLPKAMIRDAMRAAKDGVRDKIQKYIDKNGHQAAIDMCVRGLAKHGIGEDAIMAKFSVAKISALSVDDIVAIRGDLFALDEGQDRAESLYPAMVTMAATSDADGLIGDGDE